MTAGSFDDPVADTGSSGLASPTLTRATVFESPGSGFSLVPLSLSSGAKEVGPATVKGRATVKGWDPSKGWAATGWATMKGWATVKGWAPSLSPSCCRRRSG
jgi:hypothetical protein